MERPVRTKRNQLAVVLMAQSEGKERFQQEILRQAEMTVRKVSESAFAQTAPAGKSRLSPQRATRIIKLS